MSITVKIKTNNNRVNNFSKSTKQKNRRYIKLNCGIDGNVMFSLHSKAAMTICCLNTHNTWMIRPPNSACSINILMSKHSFLSTMRLFRLSAPVERLFSFGGLIHIAKRNRLSDKMFETLLMLKANANLCAQ